MLGFLGLGLGNKKKTTVSSVRTIAGLSTYDLDFAANTYKGGNVTFTDGYTSPKTDVFRFPGYRYTPSWVENIDGSVTPYAANCMRRNGRGLWVEQDRTNNILWSRDLTNAVWTKTNITAAKNQTGVTNIANSASSMTASANLGTVFQAITIASAGRVQSFFVKRLTGTGTLETTMDGGTTWVIIPTTTSWVRKDIPLQTLANPNVGFRIGTSGDSFAIDFVQNEVGNTISGPLESTTTAYQSWGDRSTANDVSPEASPLPALLRGGFGFYMELSAARLEQFGPLVSSAGQQARVETNGAFNFAGATTAAGAFNRGRFINNKIAAYINADGSVGVSCNGCAVGTAAAQPLTPSMSHMDLATNGSLGMSIHGIVKRVAFFNAGVLTDVDLVNFTKA